MPTPPSEKRPHRRRKILLFTAGGLVVLVVVGLVAAMVWLQGQRLGGLITKNLGKLGLTGRIEVGSMRWKPSLLWDLATNAPSLFVLENVTIDDPDGTRVLTLPRLEFKIPVRSAIGAKVQLYDVVIGPGAYWRFGDTEDRKKIGFLAALIPPPEPRAPNLPPPPPPAEGSGFLLELVNIKINGLTALFDFPGAWGLQLEDVWGEASVIIDGDFVGWDATKLHARKGGYLRVLDNEKLPFDDVRVARVATTRDWPNDIFLEVESGTTGKSVLSGKGYFTHIYDAAPPGIDLHAEFAHAGDAVAAIAAGHNIEGLTITGPDARVVLDLKQPFSEIAIFGLVSGLNVSYAGGTAQDLGLKLNFSGGDPLTVKVDEMGFKVPEGGNVQMGVRLEGLQATADVAIKGVVNDAFVPPDLRAMAAGRVNGGISANFDLVKMAGEVRLKNLSLLRHKATGLPRSVSLNGVLAGSAERIDAKGLRISIPGANARIQGRVEVAKQLMALSVAAAAQDLPRALAFMKPPAQIPKSAQLDVQVNGSFTNPSVRGRAVAQGLGYGDAGHVPEVTARFGLQNGVATLDALEGEIFGGAISVTGKAQLFKRTFENMLKAPLIDLQAQGQRLELGQIVNASELAGRLSFTAWARGPTNKLEGELTLPPDTQLQLLGQTWKIRGFAVSVTPEELVLRSTELVRVEGGKLWLEGRLSLTGGQQMQWSVKVVDFPLNNLPGLDPASAPPLAGRLDAEIMITGSPQKPQVAGQIRLSHVAFDERPLGPAVLNFEGDPQGGTHVTGVLFERFNVQANVSLPKAGPTVEAELSFKDLTLQDVAPEIAERIGFNGRTTGSVKVRLLPNQPLAVDAQLDELDLVSRPRNDLLGGGPPLRVQAEGPLVVRVRGDVIELENTRLQTTGGALELEGRLRKDQLEQVVIRGQLDLALLAPALAPFVQRSEGNITLALRATGPVTRPRVEGNLTVTRAIELRFAALDIPVAIPSGRVHLGANDVDLQNLVVKVGDSQLLLQGRAAFDEGYKITRYGIGLEGSIDAKVLPLLAPNTVIESDGTLDLRGRLGGTPTKPDFEAKVNVNNVGLRLRDFAQFIRIEAGDLSVNPREARINNLSAFIGDQGHISIGGPGHEPGRLVFERLLPEPVIKYARLPVRGERLVYRSPGVFALDDLGFTLELEGDLQKQLTLRGDVRVVTGRFTQDVAIRDMAISSRLRGESYGPAQPNPLIDNMRLDLRVRTIGDTFLIQNNLSPEMYAVVDLHVGGTVSQPQLDGSILPTDGRFKIPGTGLRGYFDLVPNANSIVFVGTKILGETTPELNMEAESLVTDVDGQEHNVRMRIVGPINQAEISFTTTDTGLNQNETLLLLLAGRASTSSVRFGTSSSNLGRNLDTGFQMAGNVTRDLVDNLLQPYISDTLSLITGDKLQLRPTLGPDGVEVRVFGRAGRYLRLQLNYLQGFQGQRQARSEGRVWLADFFLFRTFAEYLELPQQGITETSQSINLELFVEWPIRFDLP